MADNTQLGSGIGGDVIKTEDVGSYKLAVSKIYLGAHGVDGGPVTSSNPLPVSVGNFPATQGVAGTVTANAGTGTFAVSAASLPLPLGAATASKQPAPGSAGSSSSDVLTVQGIAGMTPMKVDGSAVTQPVSGTLSVGNFPATQGVAGTVTANAGTGTFAVSAASLPLPLGAATASKQPAPGSAGSSSSDVLTVQGIAGMTPMKVDGSAVTQPVSISGTLATNSSLIVGGLAVSAGNPIPVANTNPLPAGTSLIGAVISSLTTGAIYNGVTALTPQFAPISASASGDNTVVAAVAGKKIRVLKYTILANGTVAVKFRSPSVADLTGLMTLGTNSGVGGAFCPIGLFETAAGDPLIVNLSGGTGGVAGHLTYVQV